ncbi:hypothetical protein C3B48_13765 [Flavobacterium columnare]|uniref:hypothetical protein n=3 Tax=Flavobacterium columnare TaxID=996 RepID=UPI0018965B9A|nr:hypothetical protein [Flavobacterium columnare]MBF6656686.1 hypothetical protein [Flavobacterium columnare]
MQEIIKNKNFQDLIIEDKVYKFLEIASFSDLNLTYGCYDSGWIIISREGIEVIEYNSEKFRYISFLKFIEISTPLIKEEIQKRIIENHNCLELFPIENVLHLILHMESDYWLNLCINLLIDMNYKNQYINEILNEVLNKSWISQKVKHKVLKLLKPPAPDRSDMPPIARI